MAPDHYDAFFGIYGLDARPWAPAGANSFSDADDESDAAITPQKIAASNPDWPADGAADVETPYGTNYPNYCSLWNLDATPGHDPQTFPAVGRMPLKTPRVIATDPRAQFFGARHPKKNGTVDTKRVEISAEWAARFRLASLCSMEYRVNQLQVASYRIKRIFREVPKVTVDGKDYALKELVSSKFAAALVLDQHINAPAWVAGDIRDAIKRTPGPRHDAGDKLRAEWVGRFVLNYMLVRRTFGKARGTAPPRDTNILIQHDKPNGLSSEAGTFDTWQ
jgi:hypothetical protein